MAPLPPPSLPPGHSILLALFQHNTWANVALLDFCASLSNAQLDATTVGTFGALRDTLLHLVRAEVSYASRASGHQPPRSPFGEGFPAFEVLIEGVRWAGDELLALALTARPGMLVTQHPPALSIQYPLADLMPQALSHSAEHRTQVSAILTSLGLEPPDLSGWRWMEDRGVLKELGEGR
jgi:uncharacterized damage-inducible protein DinB